MAVVRAAAGDDWEDVGSRTHLGQAMLRKAIEAAGKPRVAFAAGPASSKEPRHVVAYQLRSNATQDGDACTQMMIHVLSDFAWCANLPKLAPATSPPPPPPVPAGLQVIVHSTQRATAIDVLTGTAVAVSHNGTELTLTLPSFAQFIVLRVEFG